MNEERVRRWLALSELEGLGPAGVTRCIEAHGGLDAAWDVLLRHRPELRAAWERSAQMLDAVVQADGRSVSWEQPEYPPALAEIRTAPHVLHMRGAPVDALGPCVAVVGTRRCTSEGAGWAFRIGKELALHGYAVVSGLARGIDVAAMKGALVGGGRVVAVFAHGFDRIHPSSHTRMAQAILDAGGAWWSEFAPGVPAEPWRFAWRNRIAVGASQALVMVQSPGRGGAMISVRWALEECREVFVAEPRCASGTWDGNRSLLREHAEVGVLEPADVLLRLGARPHRTAATPQSSLPPRLHEAWSAVLERDGADAATIARALGISASETRTRMLLLELSGHVRRVPGEWFVASVTGIDR